ncbi:hypothetical protein LG290_08105 [Halomonas sediminis]
MSQLDQPNGNLVAEFRLVSIAGLTDDKHPAGYVIESIVSILSLAGTIRDKLSEMGFHSLYGWGLPSKMRNRAEAGSQQILLEQTFNGERRMKIQTFQDLIEWTQQLHAYLAECLKHCATQQEEARAKWLLEYLADHEATLGQTVANFEKQADPKALHTWVYDYLSHVPITPHQACSSPYAEMSFDDISREIFSLHDQVIALYRYLEGRADIPEARELVNELLKLEEHEAMRLAQQINRARDL